ncbi:2Fe-2S iron-sulfur cluster-binding protein [Cupriavidus nantongensis]|uniref:PDR/VanB family oxidoreductase n=1 Tax=Cupriavidus nantongensis TaxID=1796606 RepID=UPI00358F80A2
MTDGTLTVRIARKTVEAIDVCSFELVRADGLPLPAFSAGSHIDVHLPEGRVRQYSLCNDPAESQRYQIAVLRDEAGRGGSKSIHDQVHEGDLMTVNFPRNHFALAHEAPHHLLLAGGIGVTPILCMAERLARTGQSFSMHYCSRSRARTAFLHRISTSAFAKAVTFYHDDVQRIDLRSTLTSVPQGSHLYVCGPRGFMDAVLGNARELGWPESRLHYEFFGAKVEKQETDGSFQVQIASTGALIDVAPNCTVLEALSSHGVEILSSCEQGVCGTCLTRILEGSPDHRDSYLTAEEQQANDQFLPCCSRSKSPLLVLDL